MRFSNNDALVHTGVLCTPTTRQLSAGNSCLPYWFDWDDQFGGQQPGLIGYVPDKLAAGVDHPSAGRSSLESTLLFGGTTEFRKRRSNQFARQQSILWRCQL